MIELRTLGPTELKADDGGERHTVLAQPKLFGVLIYLAVATPRGFHRRDTLHALFWPELGADRARNALNKAVHFLRRALGDGAILGRGDGEIAIDEAAVWCDAIEFARCCERGLVDRALELYRGDLLPGFFLQDAPAFERWLEGERARLRALAVRAALTGAEQRLDDDPVAAAAFARRALAIAPDDEAALRGAVALLDRAGERAGAVRAYDEFAARLAREYALEPSPETGALAQAIRARSAASGEPPRLVAPGGARDPGGDAGVMPPVLPPAAAAPRSLGWRVSIGAAAGVALLALLAAVLGDPTGPSARPAVVASASVIAVTPFAPASADTLLARIGRDLVVTLSANLDGVGDIRAVDPLAILAHGDALGRRPLTREDGLALARRLGASAVVHGVLVREGRNVRLDFGFFPTDGAAPLAQASVVAPPDSLTTLTDSATWAILRRVWRRRTPPTPSLAAVTTRSVPALRAFLEGERAMAENRWEVAIDAFDRAVALDSTFWLAYWRTARARDWVYWPVPGEVRRAYQEHRGELPERERLMIEAAMADSMSVRLSRARAVTERYPDHWPAWFYYAEQLLYWGPLLGHTHADTRAAFDRTAALSPPWAAVIWPQMLTAAIDRDTAPLATLLARQAAVPHDSTSKSGGFDWPLQTSYLAHLVRNGGVPDPAYADPLARAMAAYVGRIPMERVVHGFTYPGFHAASIDVAERLLRRAPRADVAATHRRLISYSWAARGRWDSALVVAARDARGSAAPAAAPTAALHGYRLAAAGAWLGAVAPAEVRRWRAALSPATAAQLPAPDRAELAWLDGIAAAAAGDRAGLVAAREAMRREGTASAPALDRSLAALERELAGARREAAGALVAMERERAERSGAGAFDDRHPFLLGVNRLAASRWLLALGDTATAARLLTWPDTFMPTLIETAYANATLAAPAYLLRARIEEASGRPALARASYQQVVDRYDAPDAASRPLADEARRALSRLR